jgi:hypothetical protein
MKTILMILTIILIYSCRTNVSKDSNINPSMCDNIFLTLDSGQILKCNEIMNYLDIIYDNELLNQREIQYQKIEIEDSLKYFSFTFLHDTTCVFPSYYLEVDKKITYGDLNMDSQMDCVIEVRSMAGTGCTYYYLIFIKKDGIYEYKTYFTPSFNFENFRVYESPINKIKILDSKIIGEVFAYSYLDAHCCPSKKIRVSYEFRKNNINLTEISLIK